VGRSTYAGTSAVTMNHRQMAGRLRKASCGTSTDQLGPCRHSVAQAFAPTISTAHCPSFAAAKPRRPRIGPGLPLPGSDRGRRNFRLKSFLSSAAARAEKIWRSANLIFRINSAARNLNCHRSNAYRAEIAANSYRMNA
jgi:hypothetical protein